MTACSLYGSTGENATKTWVLVSCATLCVVGLAVVSVPHARADVIYVYTGQPVLPDGAFVGCGQYLAGCWETNH